MELYRIFHFANGFNFRVEGIASLKEDTTGKILLTLLSGETVFVPAGWIATSFREVPPVPPSDQDSDVEKLFKNLIEEKGKN